MSCINIFVSNRDTRKGVKRRERLALHSKSRFRKIAVSRVLLKLVTIAMVASPQPPVADFYVMIYTFDSEHWWQWLDLNVPEFAYTTRAHPDEYQHIIVDISDPIYNALLFHSDIAWLEPLWMH